MRLARKFSRLVFPYMERLLGLHITPADYYSPIPRLDELPSDIYDHRYSLRGLEMNEGKQLYLLEQVMPRYLEEYRPEPNPGLSLADAFLLYVMIRERKPALMIEIGSGHSTLIAKRALERNRADGVECDFVCVEPYPADFLRSTDGIRLVEKPVQSVDLDLFEGADLLFIDSSHVCRIGSDVTHEVLEILPRLPVGALVHWHDIMIPANYWQQWTERDLYFWNESYFLHAFLLFNRAFEVSWGSRFMALRNGERMAKLLPFFKPDHHVTSLWAQRTGE